MLVPTAANHLLDGDETVCGHLNGHVLGSDPVEDVGLEGGPVKPGV